MASCCRRKNGECSHRQKMKGEELKAFFKEHDLNGDGRLSIDELCRAFGSLGAFLPLYRAYRSRHLADANGDGYICEHELDQLVLYGQKCNYSI